MMNFFKKKNQKNIAISKEVVNQESDIEKKNWVKIWGLFHKQSKNIKLIIF